MRRVLHLKLVTQCAMLEDFGIFLVLADKVRIAFFPPTTLKSCSHYLHIISKRWYLPIRPHPMPHEPLKNLTVPRTCSSSVWVQWVGVL
jgi:hypothetical protein